MDNAMNEYDYWFVVPLDENGHIDPALDEGEWVQKFSTFRDAMRCVNTDRSIPATILPGWMWFNIKQVCPHCRGTGKEVYTMLRTVDECSYCNGTGRRRPDG